MGRLYGRDDIVIEFTERIKNGVNAFSIFGPPGNRPLALLCYTTSTLRSVSKTDATGPVSEMLLP